MARGQSFSHSQVNDLDFSTSFLAKNYLFIDDFAPISPIKAKMLWCWWWGKIEGASERANLGFTQVKWQSSLQGVAQPSTSIVTELAIATHALSWICFTAARATLFFVLHFSLFSEGVEMVVHSKTTRSSGLGCVNREPSQEQKPELSHIFIRVWSSGT